MDANLRKRPHPDSDTYKVQVELNLISERLTALLKEKQQTEKNYEELLGKKDKLIFELHASKIALELKVQTQSSVHEDVEKRLNSLDNTNRKLEEQRVKATTESKALKASLKELQSHFNELESEKQVLSAEIRSLTSDLEKVRCEAIELQSKCEVLAKNDHVFKTVASTLQEFCSASSQMGNDQLKQQMEHENEIDDDLVKASFPYIVCDKKVRAEAETVKERRKAVNYWGVTTDPRSRWTVHKSRNGFSDKTHELLILRKWTDDSLPKDVYTHRSAALVDEHILGGFSSQFTPIGKAKSGNGNLEESNNKKLAKEQWRIDELALILDDVLLNGEMKFERWKCPHCSTTLACLSELRIHISDEHLAADDPNKKTYKCSHADCVDLALFQTRNALLRHNEVHNKPPPCIECNVTRGKKANVKKHLIKDHDYEEMYAKQAAGCKMTKSELKRLDQNKVVLACILRLLSMGHGIGKAQTLTDQQVFDICERVSKKLKFESCSPEAIKVGLKMLNEQGVLKFKKKQIRIIGHLESKRFLPIVDAVLIEQVQKLDLQ